jgi:hypothetical protein
VEVHGGIGLPGPSQKSVALGVSARVLDFSASWASRSLKDFVCLVRRRFISPSATYETDPENAVHIALFRPGTSAKNEAW